MHYTTFVCNPTVIKTHSSELRKVEHATLPCVIYMNDQFK